jgi:cobalt-zinc-cadmium efflux system protein
MSRHVHATGSGPSTERRLTIALVLAATYLVVEVIGGLWSGSLALLADAGHLLTDVAGLVLALLAIRISQRPATPERTYGYYRGEILAALTNAVILVLISVYVLYEAYQRFLSPPAIASGTVLIVAAVGLLVNAAGILLLRSGSRESLNVKSAYFEVLSDLLSSAAVIAAAAVMWLTGWYYADPIVSAGIGLFILPRTWRLMTEAVGILLEGTPSDVNLPALRNALAAVPGVNDVHDLHVWSLTSGYNAMSAHLVTADESLIRSILKAARSTANEFNIRHVTVQVEPEGCAGDEVHL